MLVYLEGLLKLGPDADQDAPVAAGGGRADKTRFVKYPLAGVTGESRGGEDLDRVPGPDQAGVFDVPYQPVRAALAAVLPAASPKTRAGARPPA